MKNKKIFTIILICMVFIIVVFSIISLNTYSVETDEVEIKSSVNILDRPKSPDKYSNRNTGQIPNNNTSYLNCNGNKCLVKNIIGTRTQGTGTNLCWAYAASNALENTIINKNGDTSYNIGIYDSRLSPTHMGYALGKSFSDGNNEYGYMTLKEGGFALDSILYLTNGIGPIKTTNYSGTFSIDNYNGTLLGRNTVLSNSNSIEYKIDEIQMISGIDETTLTTNYSGYPNDSLVQDRINTIKKYVSEGYGVTIESRSFTTAQSKKCNCSSLSNKSTYCTKDETPGYHDYDSTHDCFYHVTLIIGWDDDYAISNFVSGQEPPAKGAWIVRNSLNDPDYYYISYYDYRSLTNDTIAITNIKKLSSSNKYDNMYQYNPSGCDTWSYQNQQGNQSYVCKDFNRISTQKIANVYEKISQNKEKLQEVSFFVNKKTNISIYFKDNTSTVDNNIFSSTNKITTNPISINSKGYYTYKLPEGLDINGNNFVIGLESSNDGYVFAFQGKSNHDITNLEEVGIKSGISYYLDGSTWTDTATTKSATNFIKAYTKNTNESPEIPTNQVSYTVNHYQESLISGEYELTETENLTGTVGDTITPSTKPYEGFTSPTTQSITLNGNASLNVVNYNYSRKSYTVSLNKGEGVSSVSGSNTYKYGASVTINAVVSEGYTWQNWTGETTQTSQEYTFRMPSHNVTYTANAISNGSEEILITRLHLNPSRVTLNPGEKITLEVIKEPEDATEGLIWKSNDTSVVTVDQNGRVTAVGVGETTITVQNEAKNVGAICYVTVVDDSIEPVSVTGVRLNKNSLNIEVGKSEQLIETVLPTEADNKNVTWSSSNPNVASVSGNGLVIGKSKGTTTITVKTEDGGYTATCNVTVKGSTNPIINPERIVILTKNYTMYVGTSYKLAFMVEPSGAEVTWSSSDTNVLTVKNGTITAKNTGKAEVTLSSLDGSIKDSAIITVKKKQNSSSSSSSPSSSSSSSTSTKPNTTPKIVITLDKKELSILKGEEGKLIAKVTGSNNEVLWKSSDESIVTVKDGIVFGVREGKAQVTAEVKGTKISTSCVVEVITSEEKGVSFSSEEYNVYLGEELEIELKTKPTDMEIKEIEYTIEDNEVISIAEGKVLGLKLGSSEVTVKVNDEYIAKTIVNVIEKPLIIEISGYDLNFNENTYNYKLKIKKEKELEIISNKEIEIEGNENLKNKSVITITNIETQKKYTIEIVKRNNIIYYFIGIIIILVLINLIRIIKKKKEE